MPTGNRERGDGRDEYPAFDDGASADDSVVSRWPNDLLAGRSIPNQSDSNLWALRVDRDGRAIGSATRLTHGTGEPRRSVLPADGKRLAYFRQAVEPDVYVTDLEANGTRLTTPRRLTLDERADFPYPGLPTASR